MLRDLAARRRQSVSSLIREGVDRLLEPHKADREELWKRAEAFIGSVSDDDGATDVSVNHDKYIADAIYEHKVLGID